MSDYRPPVDEMQALLFDVLGFEDEEIDQETCAAILDEASKLASEVLAPLNWDGDQFGAKLDDGVVTTAPGFKEAYSQYCESGWNAVPFDPEYGGQGLPYGMAFPVQEMWQGANMSFGLCPLLTQGAVEAISHHGSDEQKAKYLPKLISGEWTGTMNLTEPGAGSDLGLIRTKAVKDGDKYKIHGQKIFITHGEHDMTENIIHLVLARIEGAPEDVKGISLFIVPKILDENRRNGVKCIGLEHKLGIHASPTCTMEFDGAEAYLVGRANAGLKYMFTMMNNARLSVALQGVAIAERAYQHALNYANERIQGKDFASGERTVIANHADVKRMLTSMKSQVLAGRAIVYRAALALDQNQQDFVDVLTPLAKAWCTDMSVDVASLGVQVHGGMGFVEETGAAQYYRDARILPIYEGTNGIQAMDLVFRKTLRDNGAAVRAFIAELKEMISSEHQAVFAKQFEALEEATQLILEKGAAGHLDFVEAMATPYLKGFAIIAGAAFLSKATENDVLKDNAAIFISNHLPYANAHFEVAMKGSADLI
tara:strand:- start:915 stop:2531 length:1617 start_codon:yes stop_codon:yes gene_type:complete